MKTMILAVAAAITMSTSAMAHRNTQKDQKQFSKTEMIQKRTDRMAQQLGLDDTQKAALLKLNTEYDGKMMGPGHGPGPRGGHFDKNDTVRHERPTEAQMQEMRKKMDETRAAYNAELKKILTTDQYTKYEEQEKQMRQRGGHGHGGPRD